MITTSKVLEVYVGQEVGMYNKNGVASGILTSYMIHTYSGSIYKVLAPSAPIAGERVTSPDELLTFIAKVV